MGRAFDRDAEVDKSHRLMSSTTDTREIARQFIQAWNAEQLHVVDDLAAPHLIVSYTYFPESFGDPEALEEMLSQTRQYFPDLAIEVEEIMAGENRAVVAIHKLFCGWG